MTNTPITFADVKVGDRIHIVLKDGDEATFTVKSRLVAYLESAHNSYGASRIATIERLAVPIPTADGIYTDEDDDPWLLYKGKRYDIATHESDGDGLYKEYAPYKLVATLSEVTA